MTALSLVSKGDLAFLCEPAGGGAAAVIVDATAGTVQVEDTGSTNGTFVNEEHIGFNGKRELRDGDKVRFGGYSTIVKIVGRI